MMFPGRQAVLLASSSSIVVLLGLIVAGCSPETVEHDQMTKYTPESLAQELVIRYRSLQPSAQISKLPPRRKSDNNSALAKPAASKKSAEKTATKAVATTIDQILDDIESKISLIKESSKAETTKRMIETISTDPTLKNADRTALSELVRRFNE